MPGADNVLEEAPVLVALFVGLYFTIRWLGLRGVRAIWLHTIGWLFLKVAAVSIPTGFFGRIHPFRFLEDASNAVMNWLVAEILASEEMMGKAFHVAAELQVWIIRETWGLAKDLYHLGHWTLHTFVPTYVHGVSDVIHTAARAAGVVAHRAEAIGLAGDRWARGFERSFKSRVVGLIKRYAIYAIPGAVALPGLLHDWRTFNRRWERWKSRIRKLELAFGAAAFAAYMANAIGGVTGNCIRRGAIGKVARRLCGLPARALEDVLGLLVDWFIVTNICEVVVLLEDALAFIQPELDALIDGMDAMFKSCGYKPPPTHDVTLYLPPRPSFELVLP